MTDLASPDVVIRRSPMLAAVRALRPHQWPKNLLVLVPLLAAQAWNFWGESLLAMLAMVLASSAVYLVNDLCDLSADRQHPHKRRRPLASGALSPLLLLALYRLFRARSAR